MPTVSGILIFDRDRTGTITAGDAGMLGVPIVLQDTTTGNRLTVLTDATGNYSFINVPNGNYRIVEAYGEAGGVPSPGDFTTAAVGPIPVGADPTINFATNPPVGSTNLDSITPNELLIIVSGVDIINQNFFDGPVIYTPIMTILDPCVTLSPINLITAADDGAFGFFPPATPTDTGALPIPPYPGVTPDFTYVLPNPNVFTPIDGEYTVQNISNNNKHSNNGTPGSVDTWWKIADHTTGMETGRFMIVNGEFPSTIFFQQTVPVIPNTSYLFSAWILNLIKVPGLANPELSVQILDENNQIIYNQNLGNTIPFNTQVPEWKQIGTTLSSGVNTQLTVRFLNNGPAAFGNDYAIDDIVLQEISVPPFIPVKSVSSPTANVGDIVTYTITLTNTCSSPLTNVFFQDLVPSELIFIPGTVTGGTNPLTDDPNIGFGIPNILGGDTATITFQALVVSVPASNPVDNQATIDYDYTPVQGGIPNSYTQNSNIVPLQIGSSADLSIVKTNVVGSVVAGEQTIYTLTVTNHGPSDAVNVVVDDIVPLQNPEYSLNNGTTWASWGGSINLGTLISGTTLTILIRGLVSPNATGTLSNTATVGSDTPDPDPSNNTSTSTLPVSTLADLAIVKTGAPNPVNVGSLITYTLIINNNGPSASEDVTLTDQIPSIILNPEYSLNGGGTWIVWPGSISLGTMASGATRTVLIRGIVSPEATSNLINTAIVSSETPDPNLSNNTSTTRNLINRIDVVKSSSVGAAVVGDIISYSITITNNGEVNAENVLVTDPLSPEVIYADNLKLNGNPIAGIITDGVSIGNLAPGAMATLTFDVQVIVVPADRTVTNQAVVNYLYRANPTAPPILGTDVSNPNDVIIYSPAIDVTKSASKPSVEIGEPFVYTINVTNTGDITLDNVMVQDVLPEGFIIQSITVDGFIVSGDIRTGLSIGTLLVGQTKVVSVTIILNNTVNLDVFTNTVEVTGEAIIDPNLPPQVVTATAMDTISIAIFNPKLILKKSANNAHAVVGDIVTYTIIAINQGNVSLSNIQFDNVNISDLLPSELEFIAGSVTLDGLVLPEANILAGINIGTLLPGQIRILTFKAEVISGEVTPIKNTATGNYSYQLPGRPIQHHTVESNEVVLNVCIASLMIIKTANKKEANLGDTIRYTVKVTNTGNLTAYNVLFTDTLPTQLELVPGSFKIDTQVINGVNLSKGIVLPPIAPCETVILTYKVKVVGSNCSGLLINQAKVVFDYRFPDGTGGTITETGDSSSAIVELTLTTFKQLSIESYLTIPLIKPDMESINTITGTIDISSCHVINTPQSKSTEGQNLTGHKLIIRGMLNIIISYTALEAAQGLHSADYATPFSAFIILPPTHTVASKLDVTGLVEDIYYKQLDTRTFFTNTTALINVKILSC